MRILHRRLFENVVSTEPTPPSSDAPTVSLVDPSPEPPKIDKKPATLEEVWECLQRIEAKLDYFAELLLDTEAIVEEIEETPPVVAVVTPPAEPPKPPKEEPTLAPKPPAQEEARQRRHVLG